MNNRQSWNIICIFILLLFSFGIITIFVPKREFSETENRTLAQMPEVSAKSILSGSFESEYEDYLTDQFVLRDKWISLRTLVERLMLHQEVHDVYFGRDRYLIEKHTGTFISDQAVMNRNFLSAFISDLATRYDRNHLHVLLIPNAVRILKNKLPFLASPYDESVYLSSVKSLLPEGYWFDAESILTAHRDEEIFYRTDHHWKTLGAYYVFRAWAASVGLPVTDTGSSALQASEALTDASTQAQLGRIDNYTIRTLTEEFEGTVASKIGMTGNHDSIEVLENDMAVNYVLTYNRSDDVRSTFLQPYALETRDKYAVFFGGNYPLIQGETKAGSGRRILVIKDSYANCFVPFLLDYFDQVDMVDLRYYYDSLQELINTGNYTDIMFLENAAGFAEDTSLSRLSL